MTKNKVLVGIIGGTGQMGQWFKRFFQKNGCKVLIAGRRTKLSPEECAAKCDVVVITVPIDATLVMIKKIAPHVKKDSLLMDLTSLKKEPVKAMLRYSKSEVIGTHPVFGPSVKKIKDQTMILCPARGKKWLPWLKKMLNKNKAKIKIANPVKHDRMMSVIQGIMHFGSISICHALKELGVDIINSQKYSSPIYKLRMDMVGRILNQDPKLYADIEILNSETTKALKAYLKSAHQLYSIIKKKDTKKFIKYFEEAADYLGPFKKEAEEYSNYLIEKLVEGKKK
ncbi:prephenate dehydrogenase/arogenate dehydrogenase family protein [Candidatus Woesearchaeota archaeon]|nr:prephenate dehydrogenase/arogenate dehydrogenase family protein [Candidatus Woesearchaeota archaeon]